jgi:glycosyltransferase involved in cell wall biosynthesis
MAPGLVRQRNAGMGQAKGDVVFFADDDAVYRDGYARAILDVYQGDEDGSIGGVQGTIDNYEISPAERIGLSQLFMLPRLGNGRLQPSAWPAFYRPDHQLVRVEVFSGAAMSYRKEVLQEFQFDEALTNYWVGDDFEMAYRVSRKFALFQSPEARLLHYPSAIGRDSIRRHRKMHVVNHFYLRRKCFGSDWKSWFYWGWSELGMCLVLTLALIKERTPAYLLGMLDGYRELWRNALQNRHLGEADQ